MQYDEQALQTVRNTRFLIDRYDTWLFEKFKPHLGQRTIEIGCGLGNLTGRLLNRELVVGIDTSAESVFELQRRFAGYANIRTFCLDITDCQVLTLANLMFDTAISLNVFEHIQDDYLALTHTHHLLQPTGKLILIVPAHDWLYGTMDRSIGHYRRYTKDMLRGKLQGAGFRIIHQEYVNMIGALGWLVNGCLLRRRVPPSGQLRVLNLLMPYLKAFEAHFSPLFGITLLSISQKVAG